MEVASKPTAPYSKAIGIEHVPLISKLLTHQHSIKNQKHPSVLEMFFCPWGANGELFVSLKVNLENSTDRDSDEMELLMSLAESPVFVEYMERATAEAVDTKAKTFVEGLIIDRFGPLDEELSAIVPKAIKLPASELIPLLKHLSREELIDRFS
jgi:hypothetical protein